MDILHGARRRLGLIAALVVLAVGVPTEVIASTPPDEPPVDTTTTTTTPPSTTVVETTTVQTTTTTTAAPTTAASPTTTATTSVTTTTEAPATTQAPTATVLPTTTESTTTESITTAGPATATQLSAGEASNSLMAVVPVVYTVSATQSEDDWGIMKFRDVTISWSGTPGAEYELERRLSTSSTWEWVGSGWDGSTFVTDSFLEDSDTFGWYQYRLTPSLYDYDTYSYIYGSPSYVSINVTKVSYPPSIPRSVRATAASGAVKVTWTAPTTADYYCEGTSYAFCDPATSYVVSWAPSGGTWRSVTTTSTSRTISGLRNGTTYYVNVRAINAAGRSGATASLKSIPFTVPGTMSQMRATAGNGRATLTWTAPVTNGSPITRYAIQRRVVGGQWVYVSYATASTARTFTALTLRNGTTYYFRVVALNAAGMGAWSYPVAVVPKAPLPPPLPASPPPPAPTRSCDPAYPTICIPVG